MTDENDDFILTEEDEIIPGGRPQDNLADESADGSDSINASDIAYTPVRKDNRKRNILLIILLALIAIAMTTGIIIWQNNRNEANKPDTDSRYASTSNIAKTETESSGTDEIAKTFMKQIGIPEYYMQSHDDMPDKQKKEADSQALIMSSENMTTQFASSNTNPELTDDASKAHNDDGTANPNYSYLTAENVSAQINDDIERIINPIYGGWTTLQAVGDWDDYASLPLKDFTDMFGDDMKEAVNTSDLNTAKQLVPLFADWNKDEFGGQYKDWDHSLFIGTQSSRMSCEFNIQNTLDDSIKCTVPITYYGRNINDEDNPITVNKTLTISYKPNYTDSSPRRLLITNINQE